MSLSNITLSASVRQNLLSLQSTAELLVDHPEPPCDWQQGQLGSRQSDQLLHRAGLNNRASDINNLLDSIGNGVQVLQAANTGITSLQKLVDTAKSIANQVLQAPAGYTTKSSVDIAGTGGRRHRGRPVTRWRPDQRRHNWLVGHDLQDGMHARSRGATLSTR